MKDETTSSWVVGAMMALFGIIGLIMAGRARDDEIFVFGLSLLGFALVFIAGLMRRHFGAADAARGRQHG